MRTQEGTSLRTDCSAELDVTSYFSEQSVRKRKFEKQSQEEMERRELANKVRLANLEARKAALLEHQKRQAEEAERALRLDILDVHCAQIAEPLCASGWSCFGWLHVEVGFALERQA